MTTRFELEADAEVQCLPRLVDQFAQRGLIPSAISANHIRGRLEIIIDHPTMEAADASLICERMRRMVSVRRANVRQMSRG
jgi:hypothetical protein